MVTDDVWVENDVRAGLTDPDHVLHHVSDPRLAVAAAAEHDADLAVVDLQVGSMGGMAVVRALRAAAENGEISRPRLVLLLDREADSFLARRAGADVALLKPFTAQELRRAVSPPALV